ncbi:MAG: DUF4062 domain-containing protein, partial [Acidobacteria bacterium]|nr:DUF4062 domain-containing protein [Acidobacteriota bacterium]
MERVLRIVVASPGDVQPERDSLQNVIEELNRGIAGDRGLLLRLSRWETDAHPGFHPEGPQGLIDPILKIGDCHLLIGIFWKRFGTLTADGTTGTEHEFNIAYRAWREKDRPQIFVYFNQKSYTPKSKAETDQWGAVLEFQKNFPKEGLWWPYKGKAQFERLVRNQLTNYIRNLPKSDKDGHQPPPQNRPPADDSRGRPADELVRTYLKKLAENISRVRLLGESEARELNQVF